MEVDFVKNPIIRPISHANEIYLGRKKPIKVYQRRIEDLLNDKHEEILLHGSGMAIATVIELVNEVRPLFKDMTIKTSSVQVIDESSKGSKIRAIPAIHVLLVV